MKAHTHANVERRARRVPFSPAAAQLLRTTFSIAQTPTKEQRERLAALIGTTERRIQVWFQNRRQRVMPGVSHVPRSVALVGLTALNATKEGHVEPDMKMEVFMSADAPHIIMWASDDWLRFCGFTVQELDQKTLKLIQGPGTDLETVKSIKEAAKQHTSISAMLTNYTKHGIPFRHMICCEPLCNSLNEPVLYKAYSSNVSLMLDAVDHTQVLSPAPSGFKQPVDEKYDTAEDD